MKPLKTHKDLEVYKNAFNGAIKIYEISEMFPREEKYSLTDQIRRSSRSVCANLAEAFRKRRYLKAFIAKLSDAEAEGAETQVWLEFSLEHQYINNKQYENLYNIYNYVLSQIVIMTKQPEKWCY